MTMLVGGLGALVLLQVASMLITAHRRSSRARELGCEPPPLVPNDSFLGIATLRGMLDADSKMMFAEFLFGRYRRMTETLGRPAATIQYNTLGATMIQTYDPKNVQALLATQFNDFGLGANRNGNMGAMLGSGIVSLCPRLLGHAADPVYSSLKMVKPGSTLEPCYVYVRMK